MAQHADRHNQSNTDNGFGPAATPAIGPTVDTTINSAGLNELLATDPASMTTGERIDSVLALAKLRGQVDAALTRSVGAFDANVDFAADGARSTNSWIAARTELSQSEAKAFWQQARDLRPCPSVEEAYQSGVLGSAKVRALLRAREGVAPLFAEQEAEMVEVIRPLTVRAAEIYLARWRQAALATANQDDGPPPDDPADNSLHVSATFQGRRAITGDLDVINGATFQNLLAAEVDRMFAAGEFRADDGLLPSQRTAQALLELCRRGAERSSQRGETRPSITIQVDLTSLLGLPIDNPGDLLSRRCELPDGTVVPLTTVLELMDDATLNVILGHLGIAGRFHPVGEVRQSRSANGRQRRALDVRDGGCVFPGCDRPAAWTDAHHLDGWQATHQTAVPRLVLLCSFHHHQVHDHGFRLTADRHGQVTVHRPDGTVLPTPPQGHQLPTDPDPPPGPPEQRKAPPPSRFRPLTERRTEAERSMARQRALVLRRLAEP